MQEDCQGLSPSHWSFVFVQVSLPGVDRCIIGRAGVTCSFLAPLGGARTQNVPTAAVLQSVTWMEIGSYEQLTTNLPVSQHEFSLVSVC